MLGRLQDAMPFSTSAFVHGLLLGYLLVSHVPPLAREGSVYDQEIRPYEKKLVWYNLKEKLPDVGAIKASKDKRPLRARVKFNQNLVAGEKDLAVPPQLIRMPAPQIDLPKALPLPNVLAVAPPAKPLRKFQAPPPTPKPLPPAALLPDAPQLTAALPPKTLPFEAALPKPKPRAFVPPPSRKGKAPAALPETAAAPELHMAAPTLAPPTVPRGFAPPPVKAQKPGAPAPDAPPPVPGLTAAAPSPATLAIVGLNPTTRTDVPPPPGSHDAGFSAGPELHPKGASETPSENAAVNVPGLVARGGAGGVKENPGSLMSVFAPLAARRMPTDVAAAPHGTTPAPARHPGPQAAHVSSAPDPRLDGRYIYTMALEMPNVTSYSGSWIIWFADRDPVTRTVVVDLSPPIPTRKVDPKYIQTAVEEKVQGVVRVSAVIRRDGHVQLVQLLQHLDDRLDRSAQEALAKWEFEPAMRDGLPVDVDAVFEIPFRLAPKTSR